MEDPLCERIMHANFLEDTNSSYIVIITKNEERVSTHVYIGRIEEKDIIEQLEEEDKKETDDVTFFIDGKESESEESEDNEENYKVKIKNMI